MHFIILINTDAFCIKSVKPFGKMSFLNKVVLITGASSGFGEAIALNFASLSASLSVIDRNGDSLENCAAQCRKLNGGKVLKHVFDLRNDELVQKVVDDTVKEFGNIDILINCAGIFGNDHGSILDPEAMENFDAVMAVNLRALVCLTNCAAPILIKSKGCIINIASVVALLATTDAFAYHISKSAISHFTKCVALELAPYEVRANAILPGGARTNILLNSGASIEKNNLFYEFVQRITPLKRLIEPKDIADMAVYLASDSARNITGSDFSVDGGLPLLYASME